jgi:pseudouridine-5'-phosphate glycosidase
MHRAVEERGATPALIAVVKGTLRVGLGADEVVALGEDEGAGKAAAADLACVMRSGGTAGTTVGATLAAVRLAAPRPIEVMATGGLGGVHRGWTSRLDVSADLRELSRTACCVVCCGVKSILDVAATLEALGSLGILVAGYRTDHLPLFLSAGGPALRVPHRLDGALATARVCRLRWGALREAAAVVLAQPPPPGHALREGVMEEACAAALEQAARLGVEGPHVTPFLLAELGRRTGGRSVAANVALLEANAALAADVAVALCSGATGGDAAP